MSVQNLSEVSWLIMIVQVPAAPSRHRVAVWRELRRFGGVPVGQGTWTAPDVPACRAGAEKARELAQAGGGDLILLTTGSGDDAAKLRDLFMASREDEWKEFLADCTKFTDEVAREIAKQKFTLAELEEEEQSLDRLRRWSRSIRSKDVFGGAGAARAEEELATCIEALDDFAGHVYRQVHS